MSDKGRALTDIKTSNVSATNMNQGQRGQPQGQRKAYPPGHTINQYYGTSFNIILAGGGTLNIPGVRATGREATVLENATAVAASRLQQQQQQQHSKQQKQQAIDLRISGQRQGNPKQQELFSKSTNQPVCKDSCESRSQKVEGGPGSSLEQSKSK